MSLFNEHNQERMSQKENDLPPLEPTADVPVTHSDKVHGERNWQGLQESFHGETAKLSPEQTDDVLLGRTTYEERVGKTAVVPPEHRDVKQDKKSLGWKKPAAVVALLGAAAAGTFGILKATTGENNSVTPNEEPTISAPVVPGETIEVSTLKFGISSVEYANDPEALGKEYYSQFNKFLIAGVDEKSANASSRFETPLPEYVDSLSTTINQEFVESIFAPGWESDPELAAYVQSIADVAHSTRTNRIISYGGGTDNQEQGLYVREFRVDEISGTTDPLETSIRWHGYESRDMNANGINPNEDTGGDIFTWKEIDGQLKITGVSHYSS